MNTTRKPQRKKIKNIFKNLLTMFQNYDIIKYKQKQKNRKGGNYFMELKVLVETVKGAKYTVSNDKIKQTERNGLKRDFVSAVAEKLGEDVEIVGMSKKGVIIAVENDIEGAIYATVDVVLKDLDYDPTEDITDYNIALAKRLEREEKRKANAKG